jgi:hypothetical protein
VALLESTVINTLSTAARFTDSFTFARTVNSVRAPKGYIKLSSLFVCSMKNRALLVTKLARLT